MQIQSTYIPPQEVQRSLTFNTSEKTTSFSLSRSSGENSNGFSPLLAFSSQTEISELHFTSTETAFAYRKDNSLALKARRDIDVQMKQERYTIEATLSAEMLGLSAKDFEATGNKPIEFFFSFKQSDLQVKYQSSTAERKTLRKPEEILHDLIKSLASILKEKGDKNITVMLDEEAIKLLMQDERFAKVVRDVINLINILNQLKLHGGERNNYEIKLSGKGKPYIDHQESISVRGSESTFEFKLTILPPKAEENPKIPEAAEAVLDPVSDEAQAQAMLSLSI